jgi:hypothetical protein
LRIAPRRLLRSHDEGRAREGERPLRWLEPGRLGPLCAISVDFLWISVDFVYFRGTTQQWRLTTEGGYQRRARA